MGELKKVSETAAHFLVIRSLGNRLEIWWSMLRSWQNQYNLQLPQWGPKCFSPSLDLFSCLGPNWEWVDQRTQCRQLDFKANWETPGCDRRFKPSRHCMSLTRSYATDLEIRVSNCSLIRCRLTCRGDLDVQLIARMFNDVSNFGRLAVSVRSSTVWFPHNSAQVCLLKPPITCGSQENMSSGWSVWRADGVWESKREKEKCYLHYTLCVIVLLIFIEYILCHNPVLKFRLICHCAVCFWVLQCAILL